MKFVEVTNPLGETVMINPGDVSVIRPPTKQVDPAGTRAVIVLGSVQQCVSETVDEVKLKIEAMPFQKGNEA